MNATAVSAQSGTSPASNAGPSAQHGVSVPPGADRESGSRSAPKPPDSHTSSVRMRSKLPASGPVRLSYPPSTWPGQSSDVPRTKMVGREMRTANSPPAARSAHRTKAGALRTSLPRSHIRSRCPQAPPAADAASAAWGAWRERADRDAGHAAAGRGRPGHPPWHPPAASHTRSGLAGRRIVVAWTHIITPIALSRFLFAINTICRAAPSVARACNSAVSALYCILPQPQEASMKRLLCALLAALLFASPPSPRGFVLASPG